MSLDFTRNALSITCCDEQLLLHPDKVLYWPARKTLLAADIHVGKEQSFARAGIPIPGGISEQTLDALMQCVDLSGAERLIILGDLLHAMPDRSESWQKHLSTLLSDRSALQVQVVIGNHDSRQARDNVITPLDWKINVTDPPFLFLHEPKTHNGAYVIAGHIHPTYQLSAGRHQRIRTPVFWWREHYTVLPAFGKFTGGHPIECETTDRIFMIAENKVLQVPI